MRINGKILWDIVGLPENGVHLEIVIFYREVMFNHQLWGGLYSNKIKQTLITLGYWDESE
jgi:hypothetical protein